MKQEELRTIYEALVGAQDLIYNEFDCVIDEELIEEYQAALDKLELAIELTRRHLGEQ